MPNHAVRLPQGTQLGVIAHAKDGRYPTPFMSSGPEKHRPSSFTSGSRVPTILG